jgi:hypothetical protein
MSACSIGKLAVQEVQKVQQGCDPAPVRLSRLEELGLIWLLRGRPVAVLTAMEAMFRCQKGATLVYRRRNQPAPGLIGDSTDGIGAVP